MDDSRPQYERIEVVSSTHPSRMTRRFPNILVTGTPGTGKTTLCEQLVEMFPNPSHKSLNGGSFDQIGFTHIKVGQLIKEHQLYNEWDDDLNVPVFDDHLVLDHLQSIMEDEDGGKQHTHTVYEATALDFREAFIALAERNPSMDLREK